MRQLRGFLKTLKRKYPKTSLFTAVTSLWTKSAIGTHNKCSSIHQRIPRKDLDFFVEGGEEGGLITNHGIKICQITNHGIKICQITNHGIKICQITNHGIKICQIMNHGDKLCSIPKLLISLRPSKLSKAIGNLHCLSIHV